MKIQIKNMLLEHHYEQQNLLIIIIMHSSYYCLQIKIVSIYVDGLNILEFLSVINNDQVKCIVYQ